MKERVGTMVGQVVEGMPWLGTFHSIGVKILRRHAELVGLKTDFTILDVDDQIRLLKQLLEAEDIDEKRWPARVLAGLIDGWKNRGLTPDQVPAGEAASFANGRGKKLYAAYPGAAEDAERRRLRRPAAGDTSGCSASTPTCCAQYQQRFRYILVDEYQDTNVAQYLWLRLLAQRPAHARRHLAAARRRAPRLQDDDTMPSSEPLTLTSPGKRGRDDRPATAHPRTSAASATTTSRSTAGAAPRSTTSCASSTIFPARR